MPTFTAGVPVMPASDVVKISHFYATHLGFEIVVIEDGFTVLKRDAVYLHFWQADDESWKQRFKDRPDDHPICSGAESFIPGTASCRIEVTEIDELYEECNQAGIVHPNGHIRDEDFGQRTFAVLDPDGNLTAFFTRLNT